MDALLPFVLGALALFGTPGPAIVSLAATGAAFGPRAGLPYLAGIIAGTLIDAVLVLTGLWGLLLFWPFLRSVLIGATIVFIAYLAYRIANAPPLSAERRDGPAPRWWAGVMLALANPKAYAAIAALFSTTLLVPGSTLADGAMKVLVLALCLIVTDSVWLVAGGLLGRVLSRPAISRPFNLAMASLLVASVAWALYGMLNAPASTF